MAIGQAGLDVGDGVEVQLVVLGTTKNPGLQSDRIPDRLSGYLVLYCMQLLLHNTTAIMHAFCLYSVQKDTFQIEKDRFFWTFSCFHHAESLVT